MAKVFADKTVAALKEKGITTFGAVGFCYGGASSLCCCPRLKQSDVCLTAQPHSLGTMHSPIPSRPASSHTRLG